MQKSKSLLIIIIVCAIVSLTAFITIANKTKRFSSNSNTPQRIISLSPSITEILFYVGAGERVVGVTAFCEYPAKAKNLPKVGGFTDPNFEAILKLKPDIVMMRKEHTLAKEKLSKLGIKILTVDHMSLKGILDSLEKIGLACGTGKTALKQKRALSSFLQPPENTLKNKPKVLLCIGRNMGTGSIKDVYVAGDDGLYNEVITLAGGVNACTGMSIKYPKLGPEAIQKLNPDIIIDLATGLKEKNIPISTVAEEWGKLKFVNAVQKKNIIVFTENYAVVPGIRFFRFIADLRNIIRDSNK